MANFFRYRNQQWNLPDTAYYDNNYAHLGMLMDIRDELVKLNTLLHCSNCTDIPHILRGIQKNTIKPKKRIGSKANRRDEHE